MAHGQVQQQPGLEGHCLSDQTAARPTLDSHGTPTTGEEARAVSKQQQWVVWFLLLIINTVQPFVAPCVLLPSPDTEICASNKKRRLTGSSAGTATAAVNQAALFFGSKDLVGMLWAVFW